MRVTLRVGLVFVFVALVLGSSCSDNEPSTSTSCPPSRLLSQGTSSYCILDGSSLTVSDCPDDYPVGRAFEGFVACTSTAVVPDEVEAAAREAGLAPPVSTACATDADCGKGSVCEPAGPGCDSADNACVPGCRTDANCAADEACTVVTCVTCPCPGRCEVKTTTGCTNDDECAAGMVCELGTGCQEPRSCVAGCHNDAQCASDEHCSQLECLTCPCPGVCEATIPPVSCATDEDCVAGEVCELSTGCQEPASCVAGCHDDADCATDEQCSQPNCFTCPCPGNCEPKPTTTVCETDNDCAAGKVCELSTGCQDPATCVAGCHEDADCSADELCAQPACFTCPCPGSCETKPTPVGCTSDTDCADGTVCELPTGCQGTATCVPGCHDNAACPNGERCLQPACFTCPCPGACAPDTATGCTDDTDCGDGKVCELSTGCQSPTVCVPGCRTAADCGANEICNQVQCFTCPCPGMCEPDPGPRPCTSDGNCLPGTVCELGTGCSAPATCVPGCHGADDCGFGERCNQPDCLTCPCPGACEVDPAAGCTSDANCPTGTVCELGTGCSAPAKCVAGCRDAADCGVGERCNQVQCLTCPCPGICEASTTPSNCTSDANCPTGTVCEPGAGCSSAMVCVPGCHADVDCPSGETCQSVACATCPCPGMCG